jgi:hypothetical protein
VGLYRYDSPTWLHSALLIVAWPKTIKAGDQHQAINPATHTTHTTPEKKIDQEGYHISRDRKWLPAQCLYHPSRIALVAIIHLVLVAGTREEAATELHQTLQMVILHLTALGTAHRAPTTIPLVVTLTALANTHIFHQCKHIPKTGTTQGIHEHHHTTRPSGQCLTEEMLTISRIDRTEALLVLILQTMRGVLLGQLQ